MAVALPFVQFSPAVFWTLYLLCGLSDVLDGAVARLAGTASRLGERLDTIADIIFVAMWMVMFIPAINVGRWLWIWTGVIALIKVVNVISGLAMKKGFVAKHTPANKATGILLFLLPMVILLSGSHQSPVHRPGMPSGNIRGDSGRAPDKNGIVGHSEIMTGQLVRI